MSDNFLTAGMLIRLDRKYFEYVKNSNGRRLKTYPGFARFLAMNDLLDYDKCVEFIKDQPKDEWEARKDL